MSSLYYYRVIFKGGLIVRRAPDFSSEKTGINIPLDTIIIASDFVSKPDGTRFLRIPEGWVVARKGDLIAAEELSPPRVLKGRFYYRVVHPSGARFAISNDIAASSNRHEVTHPMGTILVATEKRVDTPGSFVASVQLLNDMGYLFENARTAEVTFFHFQLTIRVTCVEHYMFFL
jgi:hypothetical protein